VCPFIIRSAPGVFVPSWRDRPGRPKVQTRPQSAGGPGHNPRRSPS
jgi:hypothetical protein